MKNHHGRLSPDDPHDRLRLITEWWNRLAVCGDSGGTTWEVLDELGTAVTDCLHHAPPELERAESLTAKAILLMAGCKEL